MQLIGTIQNADGITDHVTVQATATARTALETAFPESAKPIAISSDS